MERDGYWSSHWRKQVSRRRLLAGAAGAGVGAAALAACGDDDDDEQAGSQPAAQAPAEPKRGGTIKLFQGSHDLPHMDQQQTPLTAVNGWGAGIGLSRLVKTKLFPEAPELTVVLEPDAALSWEQPDDVSYVFKLRPGVKWHNIAPVNGRELVADDIVYTYNRQKQLRVNAGFLGYLDRLAAVDKTTVRITTSQPDADFMNSIPDVRNPIIARDVVELKGDLKEGPIVGTGAWIYKEWVRGTAQRLVRNPDYFIPGRPYADGLEVLLIMDQSTQKAAMQTKQLHATVTTAGSFTPEENRLLKQQNPNIDWVQSRTFTGSHLLLHADTGPTRDVRVRQAILKAIDRQTIVDKVQGGNAWISPAIPVPLDWLLPETEIKTLLGQDIAGAKALMQQAGVTGFDQRLVFSGVPDTAELIQSWLKQININVTLQQVDFAILTGIQAGQQQFDMGLMGLGATTTTADLVSRYRTAGSRNGGKLSDPTLDGMIDRQATMLKDREGRKRLLQDIQRKAMELAVWVPSTSGKPQFTHQNYLKGYGATIIVAEYGQYENMWLDQ